MNVPARVAAFVAGLAAVFESPFSAATASPPTSPTSPTYWKADGVPARRHVETVTLDGAAMVGADSKLALSARDGAH